jgi:hypothetical protein
MLHQDKGKVIDFEKKDINYHLHGFYRKKLEFNPKTAELPILIFGESHDDSINQVLFIRLIPHLEKLGYKFFFDETSTTPEKIIKQLNCLIEKYEFYKKEFKSVELDISSPEDMMKYYNQNIIKILDDDFFGSFDAFCFKIFRLVMLHQTRVKQVEFLTKLQQSSLEYVPIDLKCTPDDYTTPSAIIKRDKVMSKAYLEAQKPAFGRVGLAHLAGLQKHFIENLGDEKTRDNFLFFHIYSNQKIINHDEVATKKLPIDIFHFDASKHNEDEVVNFVLGKIKIKNNLITSSLECV